MTRFSARARIVAFPCQKKKNTLALPSRDKHSQDSGGGAGVWLDDVSNNKKINCQ